MLYLGTSQKASRKPDVTERPWCFGVTVHCWAWPSASSTRAPSPTSWPEKPIPSFRPSQYPSLPKPSNQCAHPNTADSPSLLQVERMSLKQKHFRCVGWTIFPLTVPNYSTLKSETKLPYCWYVSCILEKFLWYHILFIFVWFPHIQGWLLL